MRGLTDALTRVFKANRKLLPAAVMIAVLISLLVARYVSNYHAMAERSISLGVEKHMVIKSRLAREEELVASVGSAKRRLEELEPGLLKARKPAMAVAEMQELIKKVAHSRGVAITSQKALKTSERGPYIVVPVELQVKTSMPQLWKVIYDISAADEIMSIGYLRARGIDEKGSGEMNITLVVEGLMRKTGRGAAEGPRS